MIYFFYTVHVLICLFLILVVLLQQGKGADLSVFGGGSTMTAFGARGAATLLHKMTVFSFVGFILTTLVIGILQGRADVSSVMSGVEEEVTAPAAVGDEGAGSEAEGGGETELPGLLQEAEEDGGDGAAVEGSLEGDGGEGGDGESPPEEQ